MFRSLVRFFADFDPTCDLGVAFDPPLGGWIVLGDYGYSAIAAYPTQDAALAHLRLVRRQSRTVCGVLRHNRGRLRLRLWEACGALRYRLSGKPRGLDEQPF